MACHLLLRFGIAGRRDISFICFSGFCQIICSKEICEKEELFNGLNKICQKFASSLNNLYLCRQLLY